MIGRKNVNEWIELIKKRHTSLISRLQSIYGRDNVLIDERSSAFLKIVTEFRKIFGEDKEVNLIRVPARLNLLGMHIDHRGGFVNPIAINKETILCYSRRDDDLVHLHNMDTSYGDRKFNISKELPKDTIDTVNAWLSWTQEQTNKRKHDCLDQDWVNKLKAIPVYLQTIYPDKKLSGIEGVLDSNIPVGLGLSSSSAIVVAMMEIMIDINHISITDDEFINYCGIAEWFVGTRGGSGDHAAIKCSRLGMITHMKTLPRLKIKSYLPFPEGYRIVIFDSGITADKSGGARQKFNEKTATYEIGEIYIREYMKTHFKAIFQKVIARRDYLSRDAKKFYLPDVLEHLSQGQIYELLQSLPVRINREELLKQFPGHRDLLKEQFATHLEPEGGYEIQEVATYGIAESERSRMVEDVINKSKIEVFGKLMNISHDGDRNRKKTIETKKDLYLQPGGYDCSVPEIDEMVDMALRAGACGAQISGAGLGGSIMALVKDENFDRLVEALRTKHYMLSPIQGACQL